MRDIASVGGVSQSTVSRVLNDAPTRVPIAPETRERVTLTDCFGAAPEHYVQQVPNTLAGGEEALRRLLEPTDAPTAVVTSTDLVAVGVLHAAYSLGRTVPTQLSVVGFDDLVLAAHTVPALTTLRMPIAEIVAEGVKLAVGLARDATASREPRVTVFEPSLIVRQSTAPPPAGR